MTKEEAIQQAISNLENAAHFGYGERAELYATLGQAYATLALSLPTEQAERPQGTPAGRA